MKLKLIVLTIPMFLGFMVAAIPCSYANDGASIISQAVADLIRGKNGFLCPSGYHKYPKGGQYMCAPNDFKASLNCPSGYIYTRKGNLIGCVKPTDNEPQYDDPSDNGSGYDEPQYDDPSDGGSGYDKPQYDGSSDSGSGYDEPQYDDPSDGGSGYDEPQYDGSSDSGSGHDESQGDQSGYGEPQGSEPEPRVESCSEQVQGKIAWDYRGSKRWNPVNVNRLCRGAEDSSEPAVCFERVMHGGVNYGGGTKWKWQNAIDLCEGSKNANTTIRCFERKIKRGISSKSAIRSCGE